MSAKKRQYSLESGFGSEDSESSSATREFFSSYMPRLEMAVRQHHFDNFDDPTIDLGIMQVADRPHSHQRPASSAQPPAPRTEPKSATKFRDSTLDELDSMVSQFKKRSHYSNKLANIMLQGLEKTLDKEVYQLFVQGRLPKNWIPLVKMNNENTPYVEFLIKADVADEHPVNQLHNYSTDHMAYSKFIVDSLNQHVDSIQVAPTPQKIQHLMPNTSTPKSQRNRRLSSKDSSSRASSGPDLNNSKRILPTRACKTSFSGNYNY